MALLNQTRAGQREFRPLRQHQRAQGVNVVGKLGNGVRHGDRFTYATASLQVEKRV
jgi:hypothetical protein